MNKTLYYLILLVLVSAGTTLKFSASHEEMPIGCDEFGYLNLAKNFDENAVVERPYFNELLSILRGKGITENELSWLITPHAYHILPETNLVINQYQPGTSWLLSFIPYESRKLLFPALVILTIILLAFIVSSNSLKSPWNLFDLLSRCFCFL